MGIENYEFMKLSEVPEVAEASEDAKVILEQGGEIFRGPAPKGGGGAVTWYSMAILGNYEQLSEDANAYVPCDENTSEDAINNIISGNSGQTIPVYLFKGSDISSILEKGENTPYTSEDGDIPTLTEYLTSLEGPVNIKVLNPLFVQGMFYSGEADILDNKSGLILSATSSYMRMKSKEPIEGRMIDLVYNTINPVFMGSNLAIPVFVFGDSIDYKTGEEA